MANMYLRNNKASSYIKSLNRSFGYAVGDVFSAYAPTSSSIIKSGKAVAMSAKSSMQKMRNGSVSQSTKDLDIGNDRYSNILDDIMNSTVKNITGSGTSSKKSEDWGDENTSNDVKDLLEQNDSNSKDLINSLTNFENSISKAIGISSSKSAEYIAKSQIASTKALYDLNKAGFTQVTNVLLGMHDTLNGIASLGVPLNAHMQNSAIFYTTTTDTLNKMQTSLSNIEKSVAKSNTSARGVVGRDKSILKFLNKDGELDGVGYLSMVKENFKEQMDLMNKVFGDGKPQPKNSKNVPAMQQAITTAIEFMMPKFAKSSMEMFDETLKGFLSSALSESGLKFRKSKNPLAVILGNILMPKSRFGSPDTSRYNKGQVAWDGIARKSVVEVIPTYLAKIYAALGGEERYYDYNVGKFVTIKNIKGKRDYDQSEAAARAGGEFRQDALRKAKQTGNPEIQAEIEAYFLNALKKGGDFSDLKKNRNNKDYRKSLGINSDEAYEILVNLMDAYSKSNMKTGKGYVRNRATSFRGRVATERGKLDRSMRQAEASGNSPLDYVYNGFSSNSKLGAGPNIIDKYGNSSLDYLRGIYTILSSSGPMGKGKRKKFKLGKINDNGVIGNGSSSGEHSNMDKKDNMNYKYYGMSDDQIAEAKERDKAENAWKTAKDKFDGGMRDPFGSDKDSTEPKSKFGKAMSKIKSIYEAPFQALSSFLFTATDSLNRLFWGDDNKSGLIERMYNKFEEMTNDLKEKLKEKFKDLFSGNEQVASFKDQFKASWNNVKSNAVNAVTDAKNRFLYGKTAAQELRNVRNNGTAAYGRKVTKAGSVVVSEGELIIPSELNPYYNGPTNKQAQVNNENNIYRRLSGGGSKDDSDEDDDKKKKNNDKSISDRIKRKAMEGVFKKDKNGNFQKKAQSAGQVIGQGAEILGEGVTKFVAQMFGREDPDKDKKKVMDVLKTSVSEMGANKGAMAIGALGGAGVSILTGAVVGPFMGAAIGAGVGLISNSTKIQQKLFGYVDDDGNFQEGLFKKDTAQFMQKQLPSIGKGAGIGYAAGLFAGSPVLGAILGGTVGYVSSSEKAKAWLFGDDKNDGHLINKELQKKLKEAAPNMAAGALAGLIAGPFGIVGNLMVGAGVGYLSKSEKFGEFLFGDGENDKGLAGNIHDKIINNLEDIFKNMANNIKGFGKKLFKSISMKVQSIGESLRKKIMKRAEGNDGSLGNKLAKGAKFLMNAPVNIAGFGLGKISTRMKKHNLKKGYDVTDNGETLTAGERNALRAEYGMSTSSGYGQFDQYLAGTNNVESLDKTKQLLETIQGGKNAKKKLDNETYQGLYKAFETQGEALDVKTQNSIIKQLQKGKTDRAREILKQSGRSSDFGDSLESAIKQLKMNADTKSSKEAARSALKAMGFKGAVNDKNITSLMGAIDTEKKLRFSDDKQEEQAEDDYKGSLLGLVENIQNIMLHNSTTPYTIAGKWKRYKTLKAAGKKAASDVANGIIGEQKDHDYDKEGAEDVQKLKDHVQYTMFGPVQYTTNNQGEPVIDTRDKETQVTNKKNSTFFNAIKSVPGIGAAIGGVSGLLGKLKDGLLGNDKEKKPGILSKLMSKLFGDDGVLSGLFGFFTGDGSFAKKLLSKVSLKGVLSNIVGPALLAAGLGGAFDSAANVATNGAYGIKDDSTTATDANGNTVTKTTDANGNEIWVDQNGNQVDPNSVSNVKVRKTDSDKLSTKMQKNIGRGILTNTKNIGSAVLGKTAIGKGIKSLAKSNAGTDLKNVLKNGTDDFAGLALQSSMGESLMKVADKIAPLLAKMGIDPDTTKGMFSKLATKIANAAGSSTAQTAAKTAGQVVVVARIAFAVADFTTGYEDARSTLGIVKEPTIGQRILSGVLRLVKNLIPIVGTLIPDSLVVDVCCDYIAPALGIDAKELKNAREEAKETVDQYNQANGTNIGSVQEFNKSVLKDYTWTERIGNAAKSTVADTKNKFGKFKNNVKENGLGGAIKQMGSEAVSTFKESYKENGGGLAGISSGIGDAFGNMLPGVLGEITKANADIRSKAFKGDLKGLWGVALSDFSGGGEDVEGTDLQTAVPSMFSKAIGQIPLIVNKITNTPVALVFKVLDKVNEGIQPVIDKVKDFSVGIASITGDNASYVKSGDPVGLWKGDKDEKEDKDNPLGGFGKAVSGVEKVTLTPFATVSWVGHKVYDGVSGLITKAKNSITAVSTSFTTGLETIKSGDKITNFLDTSNITDDPENPVGGFTAAACKVARIASIPVALIQWVGGKVKDKFDSFKEKIVTGYTNIMQNYATIEGFAQAGNPASVWSNEIADDEGNPLGGLYKAINFIQKISVTPVAGIHWMGNKIKDGISNLKDKIVTGYTNVMNNYATIDGYAKEGDVSSIWSNDIADDEGNPLGGIYKAINFAQKISATPMGAFHYVANSIADALHFDDIKSDATTFNKTVKTIKEYASDGDLSSIWSTDAEFSDNDPVKTFFNIGLTINKVFASMIGIFEKIVGPLEDLADGVADSVGDIAGTVGDGISSAGNAIKDGASNVANGIGNGISGAVDWAANGVSDLFGGGSSGIVSQYDPKYQQYSIGGQSFASKGCGPAVATMAAQAMGKNMTVRDAVSESNGYQTSNGVTLDYFGKVLGDRGINTRIISGGSSNDMYNSIASGDKLVLLGRDPANTSKANSPFGPNNHYVLATGLDRRGNVIVNDPESNRSRSYNPSILNSAQYAVAGSASGLNKTYSANKSARRFRYIAGGGGECRNDAITQQIWAYLTTKLGMSEAAAAGVMGNMEQESGCNIDLHQSGGSAYGLCQWDGGRKSELMSRSGYNTLAVQLEYLSEELPSQYWNKSGTINDKDGKSYSYSSMSYEQFKALTDVATATIKFEAAFERAGKPMLAKRITYAKKFYEMFTGKTYQIDPSIGVGSSGDSSSSSSSTTDTLFTNPLSVVNDIGTVFGNGFGTLFGPSDSSSSSSSSSSGSTDGVVSNAAVGDGNATQKALAQKLLDIQGKLSYSMEGPRDPEKGSADCSSTVNWAYKKVTGTDIGNSTDAIINNGNTEVVDLANNMDINSGGSNSSGPTESKLMPGDILLYSRPDSGYSAGRKYRVGHVEMYVGNGNRIGHGGGQGPKVSSISKDANHYIEARRLKGITAAAGGSGLVPISYDDICNNAGGSSGILLSSRVGSRNNMVASQQYRIARRPSGGDSNLTASTTSMLTNIKNSVASKGSAGQISTDTVNKLITSITNLLQSIANNTADISAIYNVLKSYVSGGGSSSKEPVVVKKSTPTPVPTATSSGSDEIDSNIVSLVSVLADIAKG